MSLSQLIRGMFYCFAIVLLPHILYGDEIRVTLSNFIRAETDNYFSNIIKLGGLGKLRHLRAPTPIDKQEVVRMNRDTLYSTAVVDLQAAPLTIELPDAGKRYLALQVISQDHYTIAVEHQPGIHRYTQDQVGTRYVFLIIRIFVNPDEPADLRAVHSLQDAIRLEQAVTGEFTIPVWEQKSLGAVRQAVQGLAPYVDGSFQGMFGAKNEVLPIAHLIGTAVGWGGNPASEAIYLSEAPAKNDGRTAYRLQVRDVPVDAFWSITLYDDKGFLPQNKQNLYSYNSLTAKTDSDGGYTFHFGGDAQASNYLPIMPGWNYTVRLYRPRKELQEQKWRFPKAEPIP